MTSEINIYVACLASYNAGRLHGAWIEATDDADDMQEAIDAMLKASPVPDAEEYAIHDFDDEYGVIQSMGETCDLEGIAERMAEFYEIERDYDDSIIAILIAWADEHTDVANWKSAIDDAFGGEYTDAEDYAAETVANMGVEIPDCLQNYIDYPAFARDMALNGDVDFLCTASGKHLQGYDSMRGRECIVMHNR